MPSPRELHRASTYVMSTLMIVIGVVLLVATLARGGGPVSKGVLLGALFAAAGCARLYLQMRTRND
ncbi:MAG TPA: hypothetical protein VIM22_07990 [Solirubrobacteraceae bacterium]